MRAPATRKLFLQALIQVAAACVHLARGNAAPGARLLGLAERNSRGSGREFGDKEGFA